MKRADLYRGFDSIKPDKELKANILKAVKERDKVTVIKRPLFVPIMVAMLVCLNFGMVAKLVISNKSQINMAELKARTSISQAPEASQEEFVLDGETQKSEFQRAVDEYQEKIENEEYCLVYEWKDSKLISTSQIWPYYLTNDWQIDYEGNYEDSLGSDEYLYRRYAKKIYVAESADSDSSQTYYQQQCLTNSEVIIGYKGGITPDNIVCITWSNVDTASLSYSSFAESLKKFDNNNAVSNSLENYALERAESYDPEKRFEFKHYGVLSGMCIYPAAVSNNKPYVVQCCYFSMSNSEEFHEYDNDIEKFFITADGTIINIETDYKGISSDPEEYWYATLYRPDLIGDDIIKIPDIIGMDLDKAKQTLEDAGLKLGSFTYDAPYSAKYRYGEVMHLSCYDGNEWRKVGDLVKKGSEVDVTICAESAIWPDNYGQ